MSQEIDYGVKTFDFATDSTQEFVNGVAGVTDSNMHKLTNAIKNKVTLNGQASDQQNFNFIENKVVQDGVVSVGKIDSFDNSLEHTVMMELEFTDVATKRFYSNYNFNATARSGYALETASDGTLRFLYFTKGTTTTALITSKFIFQAGMRYKLVVCKKDNSDTLKIFVNNELVLTINANMTFGVCPVTLSTHVKTIVFYNRILHPQEVQHNFTVLNNSPSINALQVADKKLLLSTDSHHVEMVTGRTLEEEYTALLKQHGKEFTSTGGAITVNNAIRGKVIDVEIKGQTVKNYISNSNVGQYKIETGKMYTQLKFIGNIELNKKYTLIANISAYNAGTAPSALALRGWAGTTLVRFESSELGVGVIKKTFEVTGVDILINSFNSLYFSAAGLEAGQSATIESVYLVDEINQNYINTNKILDIGLFSTQIVLNNNGQSYPIYEPTIQGKTRILKATKGTQNWVEISDSETRDTVTYDYKLDSLGGDLGSTPSASDYIDRARKVKVVNTKEIVFNGSETWVTGTIGDTVSSFYLILNEIKPNSEIICNRFIKQNITGVEGIFVVDNKVYVKILNSKLSLVDVASLKTYLQGNPITTRYQLATPQEIPLTDEELKAYDAYKKVILCNKVDTLSDSLTLNEDGSGIYTKQINNYVLDVTSVKKDTVYSPTYLNVDYFSFPKPPDFVSYGIVDTSVNNKLLFNSKQTADTTNSHDSVSRIGKIACNMVANTFMYGMPKGSTVEQAINELNGVYYAYQLKTPIITTIDKSIMPTIATADKINILNVESPVAPSSFTVNVPTSDGVKKEFVLTLQNSWTGSLKALLLQNGRVRIVGAITAPSTFANIIANLPAELKPSVARKIVGLNGNTPIAIEIDTVPTVKCPTTVTGNIEINTEYEI